jgi:hypothetical protein
VSHLVDEQGLRHYECEAADGAQYVLPHSDNATCTLTALAVRPVKVTVVKVPVPCTYVVFFDYKSSFKTLRRLPFFAFHQLGGDTAIPVSLSPASSNGLLTSVDAHRSVSSHRFSLYPVSASQALNSP